MSSDQGGQQYFFASPFLVFPQSFGDYRGERGTHLLTSISSFNSKSILILHHACHSYQVLSLFKGEDASDRAASVYRGRRLGSSLVLHLAAPLLPLRQLVSHLFLARDVLEFLSFCNLVKSFCSLISDIATVDFLLLNLLVIIFLCNRSLPLGF